MIGEILRFPSPEESLSVGEGRAAAARALAVPIPERRTRSRELRLENPELLLSVGDRLTKRIEAAPANVRDDAEFFYRFLETPRRKIGEFDEREYFLGEFAFIAGGANRILFHRDDARRWFDRAEVNFVQTANASVHFARLAYQRLALAVEERRFEEVLELAPIWSESSRKLGLAEEALKTRFLQGLALWETGEPDPAIALFQQIYSDSVAISATRLSAQAANNLAHFHSSLGRPNEALAYSLKALPLLQKLDSRVHLAKLRWSIGDLFRNQERFRDAIESYREALRESEELGLRGDAAAIHLVLADVLLQVGQEAQAEWEVRAALPILDEEKMVPEGLAALSLLRESVRRRKIDRQALQNLHGYFRG
jgi:tetratricopeptide (TPR) repeat protein